MRQNLGSGLCLTQCRAIGRPRFRGRGGQGVGLRGRVGEGWAGGRSGLGYGIGWAKGGRLRGRVGVWLAGVWPAGVGVGRDRGTVGWGTGWDGARVG